MKYSAGSQESSDCFITVETGNGITIEIESIVKEAFGDQIEEVIKQTLKKHHITDIKVVCFDKGALDYTIKARLLTALKRKGDIHE